jgi:hypothetical protein
MDFVPSKVEGSRGRGVSERFTTSISYQFDQVTTFATSEWLPSRIGLPAVGVLYPGQGYYHTETVRQYCEKQNNVKKKEIQSPSFCLSMI